jgi:hypothetical protein
MTYADIIAWVDAHFDASKYSSYIELENAVRERFAQDGVDFPDGAVAWLQEAYADSFEEVPSPIEVHEEETTGLEEMFTPQPESEPEQTEVGSGLEEMFAPQPEPESEQPQQPSGIFDSIGRAFSNIGKSLSGAFKRLFGVK